MMIEKALVTNFSLNRGGLKGVFSVASDSSYLKSRIYYTRFQLLMGSIGW